MKVTEPKRMTIIMTREATLVMMIATTKRKASTSDYTYENDDAFNDNDGRRRGRDDEGAEQ